MDLLLGRSLGFEAPNVREPPPIPVAVRRDRKTRLTNTPGLEEDPDWGAAGVPNFGLSVQRAGSGRGIVKSRPGGITCGSDCSESFVEGTKVKLTATAKPGSVFVGWSGPCCPVSQTSCTTSMTSDKLVTASFDLTYPERP